MKSMFLFFLTVFTLGTMSNAVAQGPATGLTNNTINCNVSLSTDLNAELGYHPVSLFKGINITAPSSSTLADVILFHTDYMNHAKDLMVRNLQLGTFERLGEPEGTLNDVNSIATGLKMPASDVMSLDGSYILIVRYYSVNSLEVDQYSLSLVNKDGQSYFMFAPIGKAFGSSAVSLISYKNDGDKEMQTTCTMK